MALYIDRYSTELPARQQAAYQWLVDHNEPASAHDISQGIGISPSVGSSLIKRMARHGLLVRASPERKRPALYVPSGGFKRI
jgi:predicted transcriptional regulator